MKLNIKQLTDTTFTNSRVYNAIKINGTSRIFYLLDVNRLIILKR